MLRRSFILNILLALSSIFILLLLFFKSLGFITKHGQEVKVPKVLNKKMAAGVKELEKLGFQIRIDSTFRSYVKPGEILQQEPSAGTMVKKGREIYILVNRYEAPKIEMPDLLSKSFRNAILILKSYRFVMGDTLYRPDIAAGSVLEQLIGGKKIAPGTMVPYGSKIDLVIGEGLADYELDMPNLIGKPWRDVKTTLTNAGLLYALVWDGEITDTMNAIVYKQFPEALNELDFPNAIRGGDMVDIHIMQKPSATILRQNAPGSLKFQDLDDSSAKVVQDRLATIDSKPKKSTDSNSIKIPGGSIEKRDVSKKGFNNDKKTTTEKPKVKESTNTDYSNQYE